MFSEKNAVLVTLVLILVLISTALLFSSAFPATAAASSAQSGGPEYTGDGHLKLPENYREWVYLTTGFDMSYNPGMRMGHHMFDNVFVDPASYKAFVETGTWPDKTTLVLEQRGAETSSINKTGSSQATDVMGIEVHVKDEARFPGKWAFFGFNDGKIGDLFPKDAECYKCHAAHAAVDTTFVQFYPTLLPIAKAKGTLSAGYVAESAKSGSAGNDGGGEKK